MQRTATQCVTNDDENDCNAGGSMQNTKYIICIRYNRIKDLHDKLPECFRATTPSSRPQIAISYCCSCATLVVSAIPFIKS